MKAKIACLWIAVLISQCMAQQTSTQVQVTVDGYAYMGDTDTMQDAKERAMKDAERKAIEQGTGLYIESYSKVHNYMTVEDDVKSMAAGYITSKKVLIDALESNPPRYHVQIQADVKCGDLEQLTKVEQEEAQSPSPSFSIEFSILYEAKAADGSWQQQELKDGNAVHVGDRLRLQVQPSLGCNMIAILGGHQKPVKRLLPETGTDAFQAQALKTISVPQNQSWLIFETTDVGTVTVILFASQRSLKQTQWLLEKLENSKF